MDYAGAAAFDLLAACAGLGLSLLASRGAQFQVPHFYFWLAMLFALTGLGKGAGSIFLAAFADRFGRKRLILASIAATGLATLLFAAAGTWWHLFVIAVPWSCAVGTFWPSLEARITDNTEGPEMARRLGLFGISFCLGLLAGPVVGGYLSDVSPQAPFVAAALVAAALFALFSVTFRCDRGHDGHRPPPAGLSGPDETEYRHERLRPAFLVCALLGNATAYAVAAVIRQIFPRFAVLSLGRGGLGFSGLETGLVSAGVGVSMLLVFVVLGKYTFWHYRFRYLALAQGASALGCLVFASCSSLGALAAGALLLGVGAGVVYISSIYYALARQAARASRSGLHEGVLCLGFAGGMIMTGVLTELVASHRTPYWFCMVLLLAGIAVQGVVRGLAGREAER